MAECVFCKIINKEIDSQLVFEDDDLIVFKDIHPQAPIHVLIVPKRHLVSIADLEEKDQELMGKIVYRAKLIAEEYIISDSGYKLIANTGPDGGQVVFHLHFHLLGGQKLNNYQV